MPRASFEANLALGDFWSRCFAAWARTNGYWVLPTDEFSGKGDDKAPKLLAPVGMRDLVMPDLQCFKGGRGRWVECKFKASTTPYRNGGGYATTGISLRLWDHYHEVQTVTSCPVTIAFMHEHEGVVRGATLRQLRKDGPLYSHTYDGALMGRAGMIFWRWDELTHLATMDQLERPLLSEAA